jgi:glycerol-3-phosphate O-acyltransferase/dihydroxyacetone phosphate acyltransferase
MSIEDADVVRSLRPLFLSLWPWNQREVNKLREMRESLTNEISEIIDEFGPKLYENFDQARILPSATVPQTGRAPGMFVRKSQAADSSVLSHPMLWLDERIFGWSRSASVGQSVWGQPPSTTRERSRSQPSTAPGSPAESDDEEYEADVDYDDVLAIIDTRRTGPGSPRGRKKGGRSYHDLTTLRSGQPTSPLGGDANVLLPSADYEGQTRLHKRKAAQSQGVGEAKSDDEDQQQEQQQQQGLGLVNGDKNKAE